MKCAIKWILAVFAVTCLALPVQAANDQTVVIGLGLGLHVFSELDDVRTEDGFFTDIPFAGYQQVYVEWYLLEELGLGLRNIGLGIEESISTSAGPPFEGSKKIASSVYLATVHWVPLGSTSYARLGLMAGAGTADYSVEITLDNATTTGSTSGNAQIAGIYLDWGADGFGARFGAMRLFTQLDDINGATADASGTSVYFDLRWAFD